MDDTIAKNWLSRLARNEHGGIMPTTNNVIVLLGNDPALAGLLSFNMFTSQPLINRATPCWDESPPLPGPYPRPWEVTDVIFVQSYIQRVWGCPKMTKNIVEDAMLAEASAKRFHPVCDWLDDLDWDGIRRIDQWLIDAFEADDTPMNRAIGAKFLMAAVRRVKNPGTKFDHMMVLEGKQGIGKSTAIKTLFTPAWFSDAIPTDLNSKDAAMALLGIWCLEFAEIEHLIKSDVETIKAFLSRCVDRYRPPYSRNYVDRPRQGVLIGTTNSDDYLRDASGNRRIWPVRCHTTNSSWICANKDQLWAEAVSREATGEEIWLHEAHVMAEAEAIQEDRLVQDVWYSEIVEWLVGRKEVIISDVLKHALFVPTERMNRNAQMRVAEVLKALKWNKKTIWRGGKTIRAWEAPN